MGALNRQDLRAAGHTAGSPSSFGSRRVRNSRATPSNALAALRDHRPLILNNLARIKDFMSVSQCLWFL